MARKKEFDEFEVLSKAMEIFWDKGYEATSVQDLVEQMGINRGSLYGTFSDKRALFLAAIEHYDRTVISTVVSVILRPVESPKQSIINYIRTVAERAAVEGQRRGCFLTNATIEVATHDPEAERALAASLQRVETAFYEALVHADELGELRPHRDLRALARYLTSSIQGIRVMSRVNPDPKALVQIAEIVCAIL